MKNKKIIVVFGVILFMVVLGVSYAWLSTTIFGKKEYVLKAGELDLVLDETSNGLMIEDDLPVEDSIGIQGEGATFSVRNNGSSDICYQIYLDDGDLLDQEVRVEDKFVKYSITKDGIVGSPQVLSSGRLIDNMEIRAGTSINYHLKLWFNIEEDGEIAGQVFRGKLRIEAIQCKSHLPMMRTYAGIVDDKGNYIQEVDYHAKEYREKITSVVTKNNIMIPDSAIESWNVSAAENDSVIAYIEDDHNGGYALTIGGKDGISANTNAEYLFYGFQNVISFDLSYFDVSSSTSIGAMFNECRSLTSIDVSHFDTSNVRNFSSMFRFCTSLTEIDVSNFDTSKAQNMASMFSECASLLTLDLSNFNTSNVIRMNTMFFKCSALKSIDISSFDTSNVIYMNYMFQQCTSLIILNVGNFDTRSATSMTGMFCCCYELVSLDLRGFNTENVTDMRSMFAGDSKLVQIVVSNLWTMQNVTASDNMFDSCNISSVTVV